ncbi:MAG: tetratricopeptide repeat protein [Bryobacteraceae bacterium]|nr:tetratricopeptide repeat protein [Bryobacteraceae bacterium]
MIAALLIPVLALDGEVGSQACAGCHAEIYKSYMRTAMARSSGRVTGASKRLPLPTGFMDPSGQVSYKITAAREVYRMEFSRAGTEVKGFRLLEWFVGSGAVGHSFLFTRDGYFFQAPAAHYTYEDRWDLSPGYQNRPNIDLTRGVEPACLNCHASRISLVPGTLNKYNDPAFAEGGVSCERCHGPGANHVAKMTDPSIIGPIAIVNPKKLDPARRESVCAQCHLTGVARVARYGSKGYKPGDKLSDHSAVFVWSNSDPSAMTATGHFEKLALSACWQGARDKLWCGTCHDPHSEPAPAVRAAFYRDKCQTCHQPEACAAPAAARRKAKDDCAGCHMPKGPVRDVNHVVYTDHTIPRQLPRLRPSRATPRVLIPFGRPEPTAERDLGLAIPIAYPGDRKAAGIARGILEKAVADNPRDYAAASQLAMLLDQAGEEDRVATLLESVVAGDPTRVSAAVNLGILRAKRGRLAEAMELWEDALKRAPAITAARVNLAVAKFRTGDASGAEKEAATALEYDPDNESARKLLAEIKNAKR